MFYHIQVEKDNLGGGYGVVLQWTTEPPTERGWYWIRDDNGEVFIDRLELNENKLSLYINVSGYADGGDFVPVDKLRWMWLGPLPEPELLKGE